MTTRTNTPAEINDTQLDDISGGPHFRNFHGASFDFQAMPDLDANAEVKKQYDVAWDIEPNRPA